MGLAFQSVFQGVAYFVTHIFSTYQQLCGSGAIQWGVSNLWNGIWIGMWNGMME